MVTDNKHSQSIWTHNAKQYCEWETMHEAAPNASRNDAELRRARSNSLNRGIDLGAKFVS